MRILVASSLPPRRDGTGGELQVWRMIEGLVKAHQVSLVCVGESSNPPDGLVRQETVAAASPRRSESLRWKAQALAGGDPYLVRGLRSSGVVEAVQREMTRFSPDVVYVTNGPLAFLAEEIGGAAMVLNVIDAWSWNEAEVTKSRSGVSAAYSRAVVRMIRNFERRTSPRYDAVLSVSWGDLQVLLDSGARRGAVIPNGVDGQEFAPLQHVSSERPRVIFHGTMSYPPNEDAALWLIDEIMPRVWERQADVEVVIAGRESGASLRDRVSERVRVTGPVDDMASLLATATVAAYPMRAGSGIKNKVLEAAATGLPMVLTASARGDIGMVDGQDVLIRDGAGPIAAALLELLDSGELRGRLGTSARDVVLRDYSWGAATTTLEGILQSCTEQRNAAPQLNSGPAFTVFTPTYNRAHTLPAVYASLRAQTFRDFEWLIVDDGSSDATGKIVEGWQEEGNDFPIRYVWQKNTGKPGAWDHGVRLAKGELFLALDSDDECVPTALERLWRLWADIPAAERDGYVGVTVNSTRRGRLVGTPYPLGIIDSNAVEIRFRHHVRGDKWGFNRTDVLRRFPFVVDDAQHFVSEDSVWMSIARDYATRFVNEGLREYNLDEPEGHLSTLSRRVLDGRWQLSRSVVNDLSVYAWRGSPEWWKAAINYSRYSFDKGMSVTEQLRGVNDPLIRAIVAGVIPAGALLARRDRPALRD